MKIKNIFIIFFSAIFLFSCQGAKDAFSSKKRSDTSEEFLVKKKTPLPTPPDINELPVPLSEQDLNEEEINDSPEIKEILEVFNDE